MSQTRRLYQICAMLNEATPPTRADFLRRLDVSPATFKRDLTYLRDQLNAPIVYDSFTKAYKFDTKKRIGPAFQLPGLWFTEEEAAALANFHTLLSKLDRSGLLASHIDPLLTRIDALLSAGNVTSKELRKRIKVLDTRVRKVSNSKFPEVGFALLHRKKLGIKYFARSTEKVSERYVSPQRLINYQSNWYLDAWCHTSNAIRSFAIDGIRDLTILEDKAIEIPEKDLDAELSSGYGIFSGKNVKVAKLKFSREHAKWVADEVWHGQQKSTIQSDDSLILEVPYSSDKELLLDIQRHGAHVEVLEPHELRKKIVDELKKANQLYKVKK
jgi:predicted DNA-binding transcriptional regulator YafY